MKTFDMTGLGGQLRYHDLPGDGVPLVFLHGLGCASSCDYPTVAAQPALRGRRMLLVDLPGSGFSDRPAGFSYSVDDQAAVVVAFVHALGAADVDLFGHSMGGTIAIVAARLLGPRVRRLVVGEPNLVGGGGAFSRQVAAMPEADYVARGHEALVADARASGNPIWAASMATSAPYAVHRGATSLVAGSQPSWYDMLASLSVPRTLIAGAKSLPDPEMTAVTSVGVGLEIVPDAGHSMAWENPAGLAAAIAAAWA